MQLVSNRAMQPPFTVEFCNFIGLLIPYSRLLRHGPQRGEYESPAAPRGLGPQAELLNTGPARLAHGRLFCATYTFGDFFSLNHTSSHLSYKSQLRL